MSKYPTQIDFGLPISMSTYVSSGIEMWKAGLNVPFEGFFFSTNQGYAMINTCPSLAKQFDPNVPEKSDVVLLLGDCALRSLIDTFIVNGYVKRIHVKEPYNEYFDDVNISLKKSLTTDGIFFTKGKMTIKTGIIVWVPFKNQTGDLGVSADVE